MSLDKRRTQRIRGTNKDDTVGMEYKKGMWGEVALGAGALVLGLSAYKSGAAKHIISKFVKKASRSSNKTLGTAKS